MVRPLNIPSSDTDIFYLSYAERLALWSLRLLIGREPPRCAIRATGMAWSLCDDLIQLDAAFCQALDELKRAGAQQPHVDCCASLVVTGDENLLLHCLAGMQQDQFGTERSLEIVIPERCGRALFTKAMQALAAALAACGYWLSNFGSPQPLSIASTTRHWRRSNVTPGFA